MKTSKKKNSKYFLSSHDKSRIDKLVSENVSNKEISKMLSLKFRQVSSYVLERARGQVNKFTEEEDHELIHLCNQGIIKPAIISRLMKTKAPWMIRNRIKQLKKRKLIQIDNNSISNDITISTNNNGKLNEESQEEKKELATFKEKQNKGIEIEIDDDTGISKKKRSL